MSDTEAARRIKKPRLAAWQKCRKKPSDGQTTAASVRKVSTCWAGKEGLKRRPLSLHPIPRSLAFTERRKYPAETQPFLAALVQAHLALETNFGCGLTSHWNQSSFPGSFTDWKMLGPAWTGLLADRRGVRREAPETQPRPPAPGPGAQSAPSSRVDLVIPLINATSQSEVPRRTRWRCALEYPGRGTSDWGV